MSKFAAAVAALALTLPAVAQERAAPPARSQVGLGLSIVPLQSPTVELYLPIRVAPKFRLEPSLGIRTSNAEGDNDSSDITAGIGAFYVTPLASQVDLYAGGRLKLNFANENRGAVDDSGTDLILAGALGGEYYVVPRFSVGLEGQLGFFSDSEVRGDDSGLFTNGLAFLRLYF